MSLAQRKMMVTITVREPKKRIKVHAEDQRQLKRLVRLNPTGKGAVPTLKSRAFPGQRRVGGVAHLGQAPPRSQATAAAAARRSPSWCVRGLLGTVEELQVSRQSPPTATQKSAEAARVSEVRESGGEIRVESPSGTDDLQVKRRSEVAGGGGGGGERRSGEDTEALRGFR